MDASLFGRVEELAIIERFLDAFSAASFALLIQGVPGIGKTTLWRATIGLARGLPCTVLSCRAAVFESGQVRIRDSGLNGVRGDADDQVFAAQGLLSP